jgi:hypothetical protein
MAKQVSLFDKFEVEAFRKGIQPRTKESLNWFRDKLTKNRISGEKLLKDNSIEKKQKPKTGRMFLYAYDPKYKETLPYYDRFPLIIMVEPVKDGFTGLNLHYLHPRERVIFFSRLLELTNNESYDDSTKIILSYSFLKGAAKLRAFKPCFKRYLNEHIRSQIGEVQPPEWEMAIFLPFDKFVYQNRKTVWTKSAQMY